MVIAALAFNPQHAAREPVVSDRSLNRLIHLGKLGGIESILGGRGDRGRENQAGQNRKICYSRGGIADGRGGDGRAPGRWLLQGSPEAGRSRFDKYSHRILA